MARYTARTKKRSFKKTYRKRASPRKAYRGKVMKYKRAQQADVKNSVYKQFVIGDVKVSNVVADTNVSNFAGTSCFSSLGQLLKSEEFLADCKKYDQFKINFINVKLVPYSMVASTNEKSQQLVVTAWDRNGVEDSSSVPNYSELLTYSSKKETSLSFADKLSNIYRTIKADGYIERGSYFNTKDFKLVDLADVFKDSNLLMHTDPATQKEFNPLFIVGIQVASAINGGSNNLPLSSPLTSAQSFAFQMEWTFGISMKGKRLDNGSFGPGASVAYQWRNINALPSTVTANNKVIAKEQTMISDLSTIFAEQTETAASNMNTDTVVVPDSDLYIFGFLYEKKVPLGYEPTLHSVTSNAIQTTVNNTSSDIMVQMTNEWAIAFDVTVSKSVLTVATICYSSVGHTQTGIPVRPGHLFFKFNASLPVDDDNLILYLTPYNSYNNAASHPKEYRTVKSTFNLKNFNRANATENGKTVPMNFLAASASLSNVHSLIGFITA